MTRRKQYEQRSSDPLPYVQVDRAVRPKATLLAQLIDVTSQHALGALIGFWDNCGHPRDLEALVAAGKCEVVLTGAEVVQRFRIASGGCEVSPADLQALELLEARDDGLYRVRGMSRYFAPIKRRLHARAIGAAGGAARNNASRGADGRFSSTTHHDGPSAGTQASTDSGAIHTDTTQPTTPTPPNDHPAPRSDSSQPASATDSGQRSVEKRSEARALSPQEEFFAWSQQEAAKRDPQRLHENPPKASKLNSQLKPAFAEIGRLGLERAWLVFLDDAGAREKAWPWGWFASQWKQHHNAAAPTPASGVVGTIDGPSRIY